MLRHALLPQRLSIGAKLSNPVLRGFASSARGNATASEEDIAAARRWLTKYNAETIPKSIGEVDFSRSSGPGGQNVNKYVFEFLLIHRIIVRHSI